MKFRFAVIASVSALAIIAPVAAQAQDAGDVTVRIGASRTKLVDEGEIRVNGVVDPTAGYSTRETYHGTFSASYFPIDGFGIDASISSPATTNNIPAGSLAGTPNLGDDEFILLTLGGRFQPLDGPFSPYVAGGVQAQITSQERDGLAVGLDIANAHGPYVEGGVEFDVSPRWGVFASVRQAWYHTAASGLLPTDATYTSFLNVDARADLDPLTIQVGLLTRFGSPDSETGPAIGRDTSRWAIRAGLTSLRLADQVDLSVGGAPFPGAGLSTFEHATPTVQIGYFFADNFALNATLGFPPTIDVFGGGTIGALPKLGEVTYGPTCLTVQFHPIRHGRIRPFVGAGISYMIVFGTEDGAFQDLEVENDFGFAFEAGSDFMITERFGLFVDVKHALLRPTATGTFNGLAVVGETRLDPWAFSAGAVFRF
ncbi:MAG TPA: OmpW family outer membrane protein [Allosphingosinicella sp.]